MMETQAAVPSFPASLRYPDVLPEVLRRENAAERAERLRKATRHALGNLHRPQLARDWMRFTAGRAAD
jgi:hypothetical protein